MKAWFRAGLDSTAFHNRPADDVRIGDLAFAQESAMVIDELAILLDHLDGNDALGSGERDANARVHVAGNRAGRSTQWLQFLARGRLDGMDLGGWRRRFEYL